MNRSYSKSSFGSKQAPAKPKIIYSDQDIYAGVTKNGDFYLFHTTLDPDEQFKMRRIGSLSEKPPREYIEQKEVYGQAGDKVKWRLIKEKIREWVEDEFNFGFSDEPSPWAPKKLGEKRQRVQTPADDSDTDTDVKPVPAKTATDQSKKIEDCYILLQEIVAILRHSQQTAPVNQEE